MKSRKCSQVTTLVSPSDSLSVLSANELPNHGRGPQSTHEHHHHERAKHVHGVEADGVGGNHGSLKFEPPVVGLTQDNQ